MHPVQRDIYRRMTPAEKWRRLVELDQTARAIKRAGVRMLHPDWTDEEVEREVVRLFLHARG